MKNETKQKFHKVCFILFLLILSSKIPKFQRQRSFTVAHKCKATSRQSEDWKWVSWIWTKVFADDCSWVLSLWTVKENVKSNAISSFQWPAEGESTGCKNDLVEVLGYQGDELTDYAWGHCIKKGGTSCKGEMPQLILFIHFHDETECFPDH